MNMFEWKVIDGVFIRYWLCFLIIFVLIKGKVSIEWRLGIDWD